MSRDVVIIGAGAIGLSCAHSLLRGGARVTVIDRAAAGAGATGATAALLEYQTDSDRNPDLFRFAALSRALFPELEAQVRAATGRGFDLHLDGILNLALSVEDVEWLVRKVDASRRTGLRAEWIEAPEVKSRFPWLSMVTLGAAIFNEDGQIDAVQFIEALVAAIRKAGGEVIENAGAVTLRRSSDGRTTVMTPTFSRTPDVVVVAAGAWTGRLFEEAGLSVPISPVKGQLALYDIPRTAVPLPVCTREDGYLAPKADHLIVGATIEHVGFDTDVTLEGQQTLTSRARRYLSRLPDPSGFIASVRPATPDLLPIIGFSLDAPDVLIASGHYRNGILLAPATGRIVADLVFGNTPPIDLSPFRPSRFKPAAGRTPAVR